MSESIRNYGKSVRARLLNVAKVHALIDLAEDNSRMKDYYDLYNILSGMKYDQGILSEAIMSTFRNRHTEYDKDTMFFRPEFPDNKKMQIRWKAFKKKIASV